MDELRRQLKENRIGKLYLLTGPEQYLIRYYEKEIVGRILDANSRDLNYTFFDGKFSINDLADAVSVFPAFSERRVVVVKGGTIPKGSGWDAFFESLPDYICLIFKLDNVDKRTVFAKAIAKYGCIVECKRQNEKKLTKWVMKGFAFHKKQISCQLAADFVSMLEPDMTFMQLEIEKVVRYMGERTQVTSGDILDVVSKSVKSRIFDLTDAVSERKVAKAIQIMDDLIHLKEPVPFIMAMLGRHLSILMKAKKMEEKRLPSAEITKHLGVPAFIAGKIRKQASSFTVEMLKTLSRRCMDVDLAVKTGRMDARLALELFIIGMDGKG